MMMRTNTFSGGESDLSACVVRSRDDGFRHICAEDGVAVHLGGYSIATQGQEPQCLQYVGVDGQYAGNFYVGLKRSRK